MFTGIIQGLGTLFEKRPAGGGMIFGLEANFELTDPEEGESIAVNGACLTARNIKGNRFYVDVSPESLRRTGLRRLQAGSKVNLERALRLCDRLGGHLVSGHVDAQGQVKERRAAGDFTVFTLALDAGLTKYIVEKGSITINGVSLTVNDQWPRLGRPGETSRLALGQIGEGLGIGCHVGGLDPKLGHHVGDHHARGQGKRFNAGAAEFNRAV